MKQIGKSSLLDALSIWGAHEAAGRLKDRVEIDTNDKFKCADLALRYRAPLVAHILSHNPAGAIIANLDYNDAQNILLADGKKIEQWIENVDGNSKEHFEKLCKAFEPPAGPLVGAVHQSGNGPIVLYDGWHRAAAWFERCRNGNLSPIDAQLIIFTKF